MLRLFMFIAILSGCAPSLVSRDLGVLDDGNTWRVEAKSQNHDTCQREMRLRSFTQEEPLNKCKQRANLLLKEQVKVEAEGICGKTPSRVFSCKTYRSERMRCLVTCE